LESPFNSKLLAFDLENLSNVFPQQLDEFALRGVIDQGPKRPNNCVLKYHVKTLRDLVRLEIGVMDTIFKDVLLRHYLHYAQHTLCNLVFACGNDELARLPDGRQEL